MSTAVTGNDWLRGKIGLTLKWSAGDIEGEGMDSGEHQLSLPNSFDASNTQTWDKIHGFSKGEFNAGVVRNIPAYSFSFRVPAVSDSVRVLRALLVSRAKFEITIFEGSEISAGVFGAGVEEFQLLKEIYQNCLVTSMNVGYEIADVPAVEFQCIALRYKFDKVVGEDTVMSLVESFGAGLKAIDEATRTVLFDDPWTDI